MTRSALPFALLSSLLALGACLQDFEQFRGGGTGGFGGGTTTATTTTSTTSTGMGGEGGQCDPVLCPGNDTDCATPGCDAGTGMCTIINEPTTTACDDGPMGAKVCDGMGTCVECNDALDCTDPTKPLCTMNTCVAEHCQNGVADPGQGETDIDCGGPDCGDCMNNQGCMGADDCVSGYCNGTVCAACASDGNCDAATEWCDTANNGGTCAAKKPDGQTCGGGNECTSTNCVDAICCGSASCPTCQSCNIPGMEGSCNNDSAGTACSDGMFCTATDTCNGSGTCVGTGNPCAGHNVGPNCNDSCNEGSNMCNAPDANGTACPNANFCDGAETCQGGTCTSPGNPCPGHNVGPICNDSCDEGANDCGANDADGTACPNANFCDGAETCQGGSCTSPAMGPCPGDDVGPNCDDSCDEGANDCGANDANGTPCDENGGGGPQGTCNSSGNCIGD